MPVTNANAAIEKWRTGRRVGRTIYLQMGSEPHDYDDPLIGVMDTVDLAAEVVRCVNAMHDIEDYGREFDKTLKRRPPLEEKYHVRPEDVH